MNKLVGNGGKHMAKRGVRRKPVARRIEVIDATPERLLKGDDSEFVNPAMIDSAQPIGLTRRFKSSTIDRLYRNERITYPQWEAGRWYQQTAERASTEKPVTSAWAEPTTGGELPSAFGYGLPRTLSKIKAKEMLHKARAQWPAGMQGFMEGMLIHNSLPRYGGRAAYRNIGQIAQALDKLAQWLKIGC